LPDISDEFSETWPKQGTTRDGVAYRLPRSELRTSDGGSGSLLPTPSSSSGGRTVSMEYLENPSGPKKQVGLETLAKHGLLPTPMSRQHRYKILDGRRGDSLETMAKDGRLPTPSANRYGSNQ